MAEPYFLRPGDVLLVKRYSDKLPELKGLGDLLVYGLIVIV